MKKMASWLSWILAIGLGIAVVEGYRAVKRAQAPAAPTDVEAFIRRECDALNKRMPMRIDEYSTVESVIPLGGRKVMYRYICENLDQTQDVAALIHEKLKPHYTQSYKTDSGMSNLWSRDVILVYKFHWADGTVITSFEIDPRTLK